MIEAVLNRLTTDEALSALLGAVEGDTHIHPLSVPFGGNRIAYTVRPIAGGDVKVSSVELRVATSDYDEGVAIRKRLNALLDMDSESSGWWYDGVNVMSSVLAGGGELELDGADVYEQFVTYSMKWR